MKKKRNCKMKNKIKKSNEILKKSNARIKSLRKNAKSRKNLKQRNVLELRRLKRKPNESWRQRRSVSRNACKKFRSRSESKLRKKPKDCSASPSEKRPKSALWHSNFRFKKTENC